jgi:hypothetical protein
MGLGAYNYFHVSTLPRLHYIVWCRPPVANGTLRFAETVRPALVRATQRDPKTGRGRVLVAYGTTKLDINKSRSIDLIIQKFERLQHLDLPMAVRFDLGRFNWLPWASEFFGAPVGGHMIAGPLTEEEKARMRRCLVRRGEKLAM